MSPRVSRFATKQTSRALTKIKKEIRDAHRGTWDARSFEGGIALAFLIVMDVPECDLGAFAAAVATFLEGCPSHE